MIPTTSKELRANQLQAHADLAPTVDKVPDAKVLNKAKTERKPIVLDLFYASGAKGNGPHEFEVESTNEDGAIVVRCGFSTQRYDLNRKTKKLVRIVPD